MRFFEIILFLSLITVVILFFCGRLKRIKIAKAMSLAALLSFFLHWVLEGMRWQLLPLYILAAIIAILALLSIIGICMFDKIYSNKLARILFRVFSSLLIVLFLAASCAFPFYRMLKPTGSYKIGTISFDAADEDRIVLYTDGSYRPRRVRIQIWYPSNNTMGHSIVPWLEDGPIVAETVSTMMGFPDFLLRHTALIKSNSYKEAPVSDKLEQYPIVIISHGLTGFRNLHTDKAELLASNGYIVASINHTYKAAITVFENGEVAYLNREALPFGVKRKEFLEYANSVLNTYSEDIRFTINQLEGLDSGKGTPILKDKLDLSQIGLLGHSAGGGADIITSLEDERIKVVMGLDPWVEPIRDEDVKTGLKVPALFIRSEQWETDPNNENLYSLMENSKKYIELYQINGTTHLDFSMIYMYSPFTKYFGFAGDLNGWKGAAIRNDFILNFFNRYLAGNTNSSSIRDIANKYDEVIKIDN
jgi:hypothetical protein